MTHQAISAGRDGDRRSERSAKHRVPPRFAIRLSMWLRRSLLRAADRVLPAQVALLEHVHQFVGTHLLAAFAELGIADHLASGPKTADQLAALPIATPMPFIGRCGPPLPATWCDSTRGAGSTPPGSWSRCVPPIRRHRRLVPLYRITFAPGCLGRSGRDDPKWPERVSPHQWHVHLRVVRHPSRRGPPIRLGPRRAHAC